MADVAPCTRCSEHLHTTLSAEWIGKRWYKWMFVTLLIWLCHYLLYLHCIRSERLLCEGNKHSQRLGTPFKPVGCVFVWVCPLDDIVLICASLLMNWNGIRSIQWDSASSHAVSRLKSNQHGSRLWKIFASHHCMKANSFEKCTSWTHFWMNYKLRNEILWNVRKMNWSRKNRVLVYVGYVLLAFECNTKSIHGEYFFSGIFKCYTVFILCAIFSKLKPSRKCETLWISIAVCVCSPKIGHCSLNLEALYSKTTTLWQTNSNTNTNNNKSTNIFPKN